MENGEWLPDSVKEMEQLRDSLFNLYADFMFHGLEKEGLSHVKTVLLMYLLEKGNSTVSAIANYMGVTMAAVSSLVDRLVKADLLTRDRSETDRRVVYISLTPAGRATIEKYLEQRRERMQVLLSRMGRENARLLLKVERILWETLTQIVNENKEKEAPDGDKG